MGIYYENFDAQTRQFMIEELEIDMSGGTLYISPRLNDTGRENWANILREAIQNHNDIWLANQLRVRNYMNAQEQKRTRSGGTTIARVPVTAPDTLAEGEFNRFYARGLCARAIANGTTEVEVYRGKDVQQPRPESQLMIGRRINVNSLLNDLRNSQGVEPALGLPPGPNSGLTVRLP